MAYETLKVTAILCWFVYQIGLLLAGAVLLIKAWGREWKGAGRLLLATVASFLFYCVAYVRASSYEGATPIPEIASISACYLGLGLLTLVLAWKAFRNEH